MKLTMPIHFANFSSSVVSIDCSEIFIECPSDLLAHAQVWSNNKHHSTVKFLIGIIPQGTITYISDCVGGQTSDKEIVEQSFLLQHLPGKYIYMICWVFMSANISCNAGDIILADRGFPCDEYT